MLMKKREVPGSAPPSCAAAQLVVNAPGFVASGAYHVEAAQTPAIRLRDRPEDSRRAECPFLALPCWWKS